MKPFLCLFFCLAIGLTSCSKKKSFEDTGGMYITLRTDTFTSTQLSVLKTRITNYATMCGYEASIKSTADGISIILPYFIHKKKLHQLIWTKGSLQIIANDSVYFDASALEKIQTTYGPVRGKQLSLQFSNNLQLEEFTKNHLDTYIQIKLDSTLLMAPRIGSPIRDGKLHLRILETDFLDNHSVNAVLSSPYKNDFKSKNYDLELFFKSDGELVKIPSEMYRLYQGIQNLIAQNKEALQNDLKEKDQTAQFAIKKEMEAFLLNDLSGYLAVSEFKNIQELQTSFSQLHAVLQQYDENAELMGLLKSINTTTNYEVFTAE